MGLYTLKNQWLFQNINKLLGFVISSKNTTLMMTGEKNTKQEVQGLHAFALDIHFF